MKSRSRSLYTCQSCGHAEPKWLGRCPSCGSWNSFTEESAAPPSGRDRRPQESIPLAAVESKDAARTPTGVAEMDRVLGGGMIRGSAILIGGEPGIGKSTLMLQLAASIQPPGRVLYVSGEESPGQIKLRADRLGIHSDYIEILCETDLDTVRSAIARIKPTVAIIDSVQTLGSRELSSLPGTVSQIKMCSQELTADVKSRGAVLFLVGHVTKEGVIAGPKVVEHLVDTVLYFDQSDSDVRFLRSSKNRFGSTDEVGIFHMTETGLQPVKDPASLFLEHRDSVAPSGVAITPVYEGSRVLLLEIQSLTIPAKGGISRVFSDRIDARRVSRIAAVLEKHLDMPLSTQDIYVNVAGGLRIAEVGIDLALAASLYSARSGRAIVGNIAILGEVSLAGEVRRVPHIDRRVRTATELGFSRIIGPAGVRGIGQEYCEVSTVAQAVQAAFPSQPDS